MRDRFDAVTVQNPRTGQHQRMGRDDAIAVLKGYEAPSRWLRRGLVAVEVLGGAGFLWVAWQAVGAESLWGVAAGVLLAASGAAFVWRTR